MAVAKTRFESQLRAEAATPTAGGAAGAAGGRASTAAAVAEAAAAVNRAVAQWHSFAGGGALWMEAWTPPDGMLAWHGRLFLRSVLRILPSEYAGGRGWAPPASFYRGASPPALHVTAAIAAASTTGNFTRRHNRYLAVAASVLRAFPGAPEVRLEVEGTPAAGCRMDAVVSGAHCASASGPGGEPELRTLLVDTTITEPMQTKAIAGEGIGGRQQGSASVAGAAAAQGRKRKIERYGNLIPDHTRMLLVPWVVETWGRHDPVLVLFLRNTARQAAQRSAGTERCSSDGAQERRDGRVAGFIYAGWMAALSAGIAVAVATQLERAFFPLGGTVAHGDIRRYQVNGGQAIDDSGLLGVTGRARNAEPRFAFSIAGA